MNESLDKNINDLENNEKGELTASIIESVSDEELAELIKLDKTIFPGMDVEESELKESLESDGVQVVLRNKANEVLGYLTSLPHDEAIKFLIQDDPELLADVHALYIESIGILPEHRSIKNILTMWKLFIEKARQKGFEKITGHFRVSQGLSDVAQKRLGAQFFRRMDNWADFGEPFDYLEINLKSD